MAGNRRAGPILGTLALLLCALPAPAREDDVDFALKLAERGYEGLANSVIDRMAKSAATPEKKGAAEFARCEMLARAALMAANNAKYTPADVRAKFSAASKAFESFLKSFAGHSKATDAEFSMSNLMTKFGYYLTENLEKFDPKEREAVVKEAQKVFDDAIRYLTTIRDREQAKAEKALAALDPSTVKEDDNPQERIFYQRNLSWLLLCQAMHDRANLRPVGDALRGQQFMQAIDETTKLLEQTDGGIFGFHATMWLGLDHWHRAEQPGGKWAGDDVRQAADWLKTVMDQVDSYQDIDDPQRGWPDLAKAIHEAAFHYGEMANQVGTVDGTDYRKAYVEACTKLEAKLSSMRTQYNGLRSLVQKGLALSGMGRHAEAVEVLNRVSTAAAQEGTWGRAVDQEARKALNAALANIPPDAGLKVTPDVLFKAAEGSRNEGKFGGAVRVYQRTLLALEAEPDAAKRKALVAEYFDKCWMQINYCYAALDRPMEAFYAADVPVQAYLAAGRTDEDDEIGTLVRYRMSALQSLLTKSPPEAKAEVQARLDDAKKLLMEKFPWVEATNLNYAAGLEKLSKGQSLKGGGDLAGSKAAYQEAIDNFKKVGEKESFYRNAQSRIGEALVSSQRTKEGLDFLNSFLAKNMEFWKDPNTPPGERQPWGYALYWIAQAHDDLGQPAKVVETLEGFEANFKDARLLPTFPRARFLRIKGLKNSGRGDDAEKAALQMIQENSESGYTPMACILVGNDLKARAAKATKEGDPKAGTALLKRCAAIYDFWIDHAADLTANSYTLVGKLHDELGNGDRAAELWTKALSMYQAANDMDNPQVLTLKVYLSQVLVRQGKFAQALPQFEDLFVKEPDDVAPIREVFDFFKTERKPASVALDVFQKQVKDRLSKIAEETSKDPVGAPLAGEARRAAGAGDPEMMIRVFAGTAEQRRALSRAVAFTLLGEDTQMIPELRNAVFGLVKTQPDLMSNLARCYEELWPSNVAYAIRAINIYATLLDSAPSLEEGVDASGTKYSDRWFDWKFRMVRLYLGLGMKFDTAEAALRKVCEYLKSMKTLGELDRADKARADLSKEFQSLKDQAESALRKANKEPCK